MDLERRHQFIKEAAEQVKSVDSTLRFDTAYNLAYSFLAQDNPDVDEVEGLVLGLADEIIEQLNN